MTPAAAWPRAPRNGFMNNENKQADGVGYPPGTRIGKYEIAERLGMGGQAIVYKAHDPLLDRYVAIKQISSHLAENPEFIEHFRKEAQILAKLATSQPALVTIHELIQEERGLFIVMEFVSGSTLETMLNGSPGPVEPKAVLQILWRLAGGLHAVHSAGVIHRDIKPGNIIIGEGLKVKIADFGVAAMSDGQTLMALGTTKYMAPELYGGKTVDARADMYSLGFIAYKMLLGRAKFNEVFADVVRDKSTEALRWMKWHGNEQVNAPALNELNPAIPKPLADIVATMMVKNPDHRIASMEQLGRAIKASFSLARGPSATRVRPSLGRPTAPPRPPGRHTHAGLRGRPGSFRRPQHRAAAQGPNAAQDQVDLGRSERAGPGGRDRGMDGLQAHDRGTATGKGRGGAGRGQGPLQDQAVRGGGSSIQRYHTTVYSRQFGGGQGRDERGPPCLQGQAA